MRSLPTNRLAVCLGLLSLGTFWLMPVAPILALAAVSCTRNTTGWGRTLAVSAAVCGAAYTIALAIVFVGMIVRSL